MTIFGYIAIGLLFISLLVVTLKIAFSFYDSLTEEEKQEVIKSLK